MGLVLSRIDPCADVKQTNTVKERLMTYIFCHATNPSYHHVSTKTDWLYTLVNKQVLGLVLKVEIVVMNLRSAVSWKDKLCEPFYLCCFFSSLVKSPQELL